jgi:hypothetical protein
MNQRTDKEDKHLLPTNICHIQLVLDNESKHSCEATADVLLYSIQLSENIFVLFHSLC